MTRTRVQAKESMTWRFYSILHFPHSFSCLVRGIYKNLHPSQVTLLSKTEKQYCEIPAWEIYIDIFWAKHTKHLACKYNLAQLGTKVGRLQLKSSETVHFPRCTTVNCAPVPVNVTHLIIIFITKHGTQDCAGIHVLMGSPDRFLVFILLTIPLCRMDTVLTSTNIP